jgi:hypothetical protein
MCLFVTSANAQTPARERLEAVSGTVYGSVNWRNITLAAEYTRQRDLNYNWGWERYTAVGFLNIGNDQFNVGARLLLQYRF